MRDRTVPFVPLLYIGEVRLLRPSERDRGVREEPLGLSNEGGWLHGGLQVRHLQFLQFLFYFQIFYFPYCYSQ